MKEILFTLVKLGSLSLVTVSYSGALAFELPVTSSDTPGCDPLATPAIVDELGDPGVFPVGERILHFAEGLGPAVCDDVPDNPGIPVEQKGSVPSIYYG
jgi:hypothetical protein